MAARSGSCLSKLLGHKLVKTSLVCENNNYIFVRSSWTKRLDLGLGTSHVFVAIVSILCYLNSLKGDFVHDDLVAIVRNKDVTDGSLFGALWQHDFWGREISDVKSHKSYRPIVTVSFRCVRLQQTLVGNVSQTSAFLHASKGHKQTALFVFSSQP